MLVKTLRAFIAEAVDGYGPEFVKEVGPELVEDMVAATHDWLAQPEMMAVIVANFDELTEILKDLRAETVK